MFDYYKHNTKDYVVHFTVPVRTIIIILNLLCPLLILSDFPLKHCSTLQEIYNISPEIRCYYIFIDFNQQYTT